MTLQILRVKHPQRAKVPPWSISLCELEAVQKVAGLLLAQMIILARLMMLFILARSMDIAAQN